MSKNYIKLQNQGNIYQNLMLLNEMMNSVGYADENGYFTKKAVAEIAINASMVTSAGKMGDDIIDVINNTEIEEGLNSVLQNAKARMQILRVLGLVSTDYDSELYAITDLGEKLLKRVFPDNQNDIPDFALLREAFMGISTTSEIYEYYCDLTFNCYLGYEICYALSCLDYRIGTSEMPLITTYSMEEIDDFVSTVRHFRARRQKIPVTHEHFPKTQKGTPLQQVSNITRTINQILRICGILEKKSVSIDGDNYYVCTPLGKEYINDIKKSMRSKTFWTPQAFRKKNLLEQKKICTFGYNNMLDRGGYDVKDTDKQTVFSPYQLIPETNVNWLLEKSIRKPPVKKEKQVQVINSQIAGGILRLKPDYYSASDYDTFIQTHISKHHIISEILHAKEQSIKKEDFIAAILERHKTSGKATFYPFIHSLFQTMGLDCRGEQLRADAYIQFDGHIIPAEIKSCTETLVYNLKGVRQALENKIFFYENEEDFRYASLLIGYDHPAAMSEIQNFIDAAYNEWNIKIITFDLKTLVSMCVNTVWDKQKIDFSVLLQKYGIAEA